jgi:hypothetical protein
MNDIIEKIKVLNFPQDQYVVIGSGIMSALGIRDAGDIDISVLPELHKKLCSDNTWKQDERYQKIFLTKVGIEINPELSWEDYPTTTEEAVRTATIIDGVPFLNLEELKKFKKALGREKDFKDIELINDYLKRAKS